MNQQQALPYGSAVAWAWILLLGTCLLAIIPLVGILSWVVGVATITTAIILAIVVISRGGTTHGVLILLASLLAVPFFIFLAPLISSAIFLDHVEEEAMLKNGQPAIESVEETNAEAESPAQASPVQ